MQYTPSRLLPNARYDVKYDSDSESDDNDPPPKIEPGSNNDDDDNTLANAINKAPSKMAALTKMYLI